MMENSLRITLIQSDIYWENPEANRAQLEEMLSGLETDLVILPEMFTTGFSMNAQALAEPMNGHTCKWMCMMADLLQVVVCGSVVIKEQGRFYNRLLWVAPERKISFYDKKHLFRMSEEHLVFSSGNKQGVFEWKGWRFSANICYDLRFPVWTRNVNMAYDVLIYSASWPASRSNVWNTLLPARAIENQAYCIGVNRIGIGNDVQYSGDSACYDFMGYELCKLPNQAHCQTIVLDKLKLDQFREKFPAHLDADTFLLK